MSEIKVGDRGFLRNDDPDAFDIPAGVEVEIVQIDNLNENLPYLAVATGFIDTFRQRGIRGLSHDVYDWLEASEFVPIQRTNSQPQELLEPDDEVRILTSLSEAQTHTLMLAEVLLKGSNNPSYKATDAVREAVEAVKLLVKELP